MPNDNPNQAVSQILGAIPVFGGILGGIAGLFGGSGRDMRYLMKYNPEYKENPIAKERLGLAKALLNARMPGAAQAEKNIYANQATTLSNVQRNATDANQALLLSGGVQGQTNQAFDQLGMQEAQDYQRRYGNVEQAQEGVQREADKVYQDKVRRFEDRMALEGAAMQNQANTWNTISNLGFGLMNYGLAGGFKGGANGMGGSGRYGTGGYMPSYAQIGGVPQVNPPTNPLMGGYQIPMYGSYGGDSGRRR